ncbi:hypothetical protein BCR42DRAFT_412863 [Absidia repens]|uniref:Uncharacterized protein n=1 Tax=Absidia repens TaxID=90262 RepID=A0A1X2ILT8_9FUNG|nr:hypothetical protein BCR42DRAFT_412863 [Absidia repens]
MLTMTTTYSAPAPHKGKKPYKSWLKDGVSGGPCSMDILVRWLSLKANFAKWRGDESERTPKKLLLENILNNMRDHGIHHRLAKDIASKISTLQSNYRTAREWNDTEGKRLRNAGTDSDTVHEELLKRFPYWDALHETFGARTSSWPMSISSIMHRVEEEQLEQELLQQERRHQHVQLQQNTGGNDEHMDELDDDIITTHSIRNRLYTIHSDDQQQRPKRQRRLSDSSLHMATNSTTLLPQQQQQPTISHKASSSDHRQQHQPRHSHSHFHQHHRQTLASPVASPSSSSSSASSSSSLSTTSALLQPMIIRPMPRSFHHRRNTNDADFKHETQSLPTPSSSTDHEQQQIQPYQHQHQIQYQHQFLAESLMQATREKELGRMKRSQDMLDFLREKRLEREQLLLEKEKTRRIKAKAELVKNMLDAGFAKDEISEQLQRL